MKIYKENYDPYCEYPDTDIRYSFEIKEDFDTLVHIKIDKVFTDYLRFIHSIK